LPQKPTFEMDGARFSRLEEFYEEVSRALIPGTCWGRNLNAFTVLDWLGEIVRVHTKGGHEQEASVEPVLE
jgi:hypothetical protein